MRKLLYCFFFLFTFSLHSTLWAQNERKEKTVQKELPSSSIVITVSGNTQVHVKNAEPGSKMEVYSIVGVRLTTILVESMDEVVQLDLPKGYYIFKIGNVVRKLVIK